MTSGGHNTYPMMRYDGLVTAYPNRRAPATDLDLTPRQFRQYVNASGVQDVQLFNGMQNGIATGKRWLYRGAGYLYASAPTIPGQQRGDAGGFQKRGPSPLNIAQLFQDGPGSQPRNPGGPGKVGGPVFMNPMTG